MDANRLQSVVDGVSFCERRQMEEHLAYPNARRQVFRLFHLVKPKDVDRNTLWNCKNIARTRFLHSMASMSHRNVTLLKLRNLACFCLECMDDNPYFYGNKSQVQSWKLYSLEHINVTQVNQTFSIFFMTLTPLSKFNVAMYYHFNFQMFQLVTLS